MEFFENDLADRVWVRASPDDKRELTAFVDASLATDQIDLLLQAMVVRDQVVVLRKLIDKQVSGDWLELARIEFVQLCKLAGAWKAFGFGLRDPGASLDVSEALVGEIDALFDAAFPRVPTREFRHSSS